MDKMQDSDKSAKYVNSMEGIAILSLSAILVACDEKAFRDVVERAVKKAADLGVFLSNDFTLHGLANPQPVPVAFSRQVYSDHLRDTMTVTVVGILDGRFVRRSRTFPIVEHYQNPDRVSDAMLALEEEVEKELRA